MADQSFSAWLRETIRAKFGPEHEGWFADQLEMNRTQLSRYLNSPKYRPTQEMIRRYADGLGLEPEDVARHIPGYVSVGDDRQPVPAVFAGAVPDDTLPPDDEVVAFVEAIDDAEFQARMAEFRRDISPPTYVFLCRQVYRIQQSQREQRLALLDTFRAARAG